MASQAGVGGIEDLIDEKVRRSGEKISRQDAEDEVIADAMETMLGSSEAVKQLYAQNATLADKVLSWQADFMRVVKAAIGPADHREAQIIDELDEQMRKVFQDKWDTALADAANRLASETGNEKTAREGGKQFSRRQEVLARKDVAWMDDFTSIKDQLEEHRDEISSMSPLVSIEYGGEDGNALVDKILEPVPSLGGARMIRDGISFEFDRPGAHSVMHHARSAELRAAALASAYVAKKGKLIAGQKNHEGTNMTTLTYAGPAIINGTPVNVGVVIQFTSDGRPRAVNVETDNGGVFRIEKTAQGPRSRTGKSQVTQLLTRAVSNDRIAQRGEDVKSERKHSDRDEYNQTVVLEEATIDKYLADYAAKSSPNYAQAYIVRMNPDDFLKLTTSKAGRDRIYRETGELDVEKLKDASIHQPFQLRIDSKTGQVEGHEGRHRAMALSNNGIRSIPVLMFDSSNKYSKTAMDELTLNGQDFGSSRSYDKVTVTDVQPLSYANRDNIVQKYTSQPSSEKIREKYGWRETVRYSEREDYSDAVRRMGSISDDTIKKEISETPFIRMMEHTPSALLVKSTTFKDRPMIIRRDALYLATRDSGVLPGHYHGLGEDVMQKLPEYLADPDVLLQTDNGRRIALFEIPVKTGQGIVSVEFETLKDIDSKYEYYNLVVTAFDLKQRYLKSLFAKHGAVVVNQKEDLAQVNPKLHEWLGIVNAKSSDDMVAQQEPEVKDLSLPAVGDAQAEAAGSTEGPKDLSLPKVDDGEQQFSMSEVVEEAGTLDLSLPKIEAGDGAEITVADVTALRNLSSRHIAELTSDELQRLTPWARKFRRELKEKSPFFRAWFGDWRSADSSSVNVPTVQSNTIRKAEAGKIKNDDTGKMISWGDQVFGETINHASKQSIAPFILRNIRQIAKSAILLDSQISEMTSKRKMINTAFMHSFYTMCNFNGVCIC